MKYITVSGIDRSGKTKLINEYHKETGFRDYVVCRDPSNNFALNFIQKRWSNEIFDWAAYRRFMQSHRTSIDLAVLLVCDPSALEQRFKDTNEPDIVGDLSLGDHQTVIKNFFYGADYPNILVMDTSCIDIESEVNLVIQKVEELRNAN